MKAYKATCEDEILITDDLDFIVEEIKMHFEVGDLVTIEAIEITQECLDSLPPFEGFF